MYWKQAKYLGKILCTSGEPGKDSSKKLGKNDTFVSGKWPLFPVSLCSKTHKKINWSQTWNEKYDQFRWEYTGDFYSLYGGSVKFPRQPCLWDSPNTPLRYEKNWPREQLVEPTKVLLPSLLIKVSLVEHIVKQLNPEGEAFKHIQELFAKEV